MSRTIEEIYDDLKVELREIYGELKAELVETRAHCEMEGRRLDSLKVRIGTMKGES